MSLAYYGRIVMMNRLLPLLNASTNSPRIVSVLAPGNETTSIFLDDLDLKEPGRFTLVNVSRSLATYTTIVMSRLAKENPNVVFIHHYPGGVRTDLFKKSWGDRWYYPVVGALFSAFGTSPEDAGEKILYMLTSAKYGGKGVSLSSGQSPALTMAKTKQPGALFAINDKMKDLQQEKVMGQLKALNAPDIIWKRAVEVTAPYSV